jgi:hypothetical protein
MRNAEKNTKLLAKNFKGETNSDLALKYFVASRLTLVPPEWRLAGKPLQGGLYYTRDQNRLIFILLVLMSSLHSQVLTARSFDVRQ